MYRHWKTTELQTLRQRFSVEPTGAVAAALGRSRLSVSNMAAKVGLTKDRSAKPRTEPLAGACRTWRPWTAAERELVTARYPHESTPAIAAELGRSKQAVYVLASRLGLAKTPERLREMGEARAWKP